MASKTEQTDKALHLKLASTFANLERAVEEAEAFMQGLTDDEELSYHVVLLTSEAVTNGMEHGNRWDEDKDIVFELKANATRIELSVLDEGDGFELSSVADPLKDENLFEGRGRGLFFMEQMADELHLEQEGRLLRLVFYRQG